MRTGSTWICTEATGCFKGSARGQGRGKFPRVGQRKCHFVQLCVSASCQLWTLGSTVPQRLRGGAILPDDVSKDGIQHLGEGAPAVGEMRASQRPEKGSQS